MRVLVALGGNAMTGPGGETSARDQDAAIRAAVGPLVDLLDAGHDVVITHGNGPQVGNNLRRNELAAFELPPIGLDWCGAQTQATIGFSLVSELEAELSRRGMRRSAVALVTRTLVDAQDPAFADPVKPIGSYYDAQHAAAMAALGQTWKEFGVRGWRRVVASPVPQRILETDTIRSLVEQGLLVVAAGGGGIPVVDRGDGVHGVDAVIDKDLSAARLALSLDVDVLVIATDVENVMIDFGTDQEQAVHEIRLPDITALAAAGHFAEGSMGPKVEAVCRFVADGGQRGIITALPQLAAALAGRSGTILSA